MSAPSAPAFDVIAEAGLPGGGTLRILRVDVARAAGLITDLDDTPAPHSPVLSASGLGMLAEVDGAPAAALLIGLDGSSARLVRIAVRPQQRETGIAATLVQTTIDLLAAHGVRTLELDATDAPGWAPAWLQRHGFTPVAGDGRWQLALPTLIEAPTAEAMRDLGRRLAAMLEPGDVLIATGDLGAGKTTLTQGIGAGLSVSGPVISPTFVLSRVHPSTIGGPALVHVDAYRLGSFDELEDLDLEASLADSVTLVEWGGGIAEGLADDRLEIDIRRGLDPDDDTRLVFLAGRGPRWAAAPLETLR